MPTDLPNGTHSAFGQRLLLSAYQAREENYSRYQDALINLIENNLYQNKKYISKS